MKRCVSIICIIVLVAVAVPAHAHEMGDDDVADLEERALKIPQKKSVATAALLSAVPSFGAGLYYAHEYPAAISSSVAMATGLGLLLESLLRSDKSSRTISAVTILGSSWLLGMIYAPLSVHQSNKIIDETYGLRPHIGFSQEELYAGVAFSF